MTDDAKTYVADGLIETATGTFVKPLGDVFSEHLRVFAVAHALALENRYAGHTLFPCSVAEHSLRCSRLAEGFGFSVHTQWRALMHDAGETYFGDRCRPLKGRAYFVNSRCEVVSHSAVESQLTKQFSLKFVSETGVKVEFDPDHVGAVHRCDDADWRKEAHQAMFSRAERWGGDPDHPPDFARPRHWLDARAAFLRRYIELSRAIAGDKADSHLAQIEFDEQQWWERAKEVGFDVCEAHSAWEPVAFKSNKPSLPTPPKPDIAVGFWRHFKGAVYYVDRLRLLRDSAGASTWMVDYHAEVGDPEGHLRTAENWLSRVWQPDGSDVPRFTKMEG